MERLKAFLKKIFFLPPLPTVLIAIPSFIFVFIMLGMEDHTVLSYFAYLLSAYAMVITVTGITGSAATRLETGCLATLFFARKLRFMAVCSGTSCMLP